MSPKPFTISLAGIPMELSVVHPSTERFCRDYISEEPPRFSVVLTQSDIDAERALSAKQDERDHVKVRHFSDAYLETLALYRKIAVPLLDYGAVIFHSSVLAVDGRAYLFTAPSGTGKTTHTRLWLDQIPGAYVLNGDKPLLRISEDGVFACGTPWRGKENYGCNAILPLSAICILERSEKNHITRISLREVLGTLIQQTHKPDEEIIRCLQLVGQLGERVRLYRLGCNMDPEAARVSYRGMR